MSSSALVDLKTAVVQTENLLTSELDGETVLMSLANSAYYGLDLSAQRIWNLIASPMQVGILCDQLVAEYAVERQTCEQQVTAFLNELYKEGLIRIVPNAGK